VGHRAQDRLGGGEIGGRLAGDREQDGTALELERGEHVAGVGDVDAVQGHLGVARALVREVVQDAAPDLEEARGGDRVQVLDRGTDAQRLAAAFDVEGDRGADVVVEQRGEADEVGERDVVGAEQDVAGLEQAVGDAAWEDLLDDEQAGGGGVVVACGLLARGGEAEAAQLVVGGVREGRGQGAARDRQALAHALEGADDPVEREEEARGGLGARAGVEGDDVAVDVDDGRAGRAAGGAGGGLDVEGVEVVVAVDAVRGGGAVEAGERAGEDRELLAGVVADDADLGADAGLLGGEAQRGRGDEAQRGRVVSKEAEVVDGVAVQRPQRDLLVVEEDGLGHHGPRMNDVTVGQQDTSRRVDDERGRLRTAVPLGVERPGRVDAHGHDRGAHPLQAVLPARRGSSGRGDQGGGGCAHVSANVALDAPVIKAAKIGGVGRRKGAARRAQAMME
jgi:hypothetical protein